MLHNAEAADPGDADIPFRLAELLVQLNQFDEAKLAAQRALKIRPDYAPATELLKSLP